jgi:hypothetical protein
MAVFTSNFLEQELISRKQKADIRTTEGQNGRDL